jgi:ubiquinone/menaquinone biosynthesis C-methylase UbiE
MDDPNIRNYFDKKAVSRDEEFEREPVLGYEQKMRRKVLLELLSLRPGERVLDIGCGNLGDYEEVRHSSGSYFGMDISEGMLREGLKKFPECRGKVVLGDATLPPFHNGCLDKIFMSEVIEHIPEYPKAIAAAAKCLKPGGALVTTCPNRKSLYGIARRIWERKHPWEHPYDEWKTRAEIAASFTEAGLDTGKTRGAVYLPAWFGRHIPRKIQKLMVFAVSILEPVLRVALRSYGYIIAVEGKKRFSHL